MGLISQLQITDYKELHDCIITPLLKHFVNYSLIQQLVTLGYLHSLLRSWAVMEYERSNNPKKGIFPLSTVHCDNALEAIIQLSTEIDDMSSLALSIARERGDSTSILVHQILLMYRTSQMIVIEFNVPLLLHLPNVFVYSALFSHSSALVNQACQHVLLIKKKVYPALNEYLNSHEEMEGNHLDINLVANMLRKESREALLVVTRDILAFLSPANVNLTSESLLRRGWLADLEEDWLKESLYLSSHPAMLSYVLSFLDKMNLDSSNRQLAWEQLSEETEDQLWDRNISLVQNEIRIPSRSFYSNKGLPVKSVPKKRMGNIMEFLNLLSDHSPAIPELVLEFRQKADKENSNKQIVTTDLDQGSVISAVTADSGVETITTEYKAPKEVSKKQFKRPQFVPEITKQMDSPAKKLKMSESGKSTSKKTVDSSKPFRVLRSRNK